MNYFIVVIVWFIGVNGLLGVSGEVDNNSVENKRRNVDVNLSLLQSSVFYGVLSESLVISKAVNEVCQQNMLQMLIGVNTKELWAIKGDLNYIYKLKYDIIKKYMFFVIYNKMLVECQI